MTLSFDVDSIARDVGLPREKVRRAIELLDEGNTVPFITRYRKDQTGGLDEEQIRQIQEKATLAKLLNERKQTILKSIEGQGRLTEKLAEEIRSATTIKRLEDLYLPFKPKKLTLATVARERGLEPFAREVLNADPLAADLNRRAADFVNPDKRITSPAEALLGVGHLIAEYFSERAELRAGLRKIMLQSGKLISTRIAPPEPPPKPQAPPAAAPASPAEAPEAAAATAVAAEEPAPVAEAAPESAPAAEAPPSDTPPPLPPTSMPPVDGEETTPTEPPVTDTSAADAEELLEQESPETAENNPEIEEDAEASAEEAEEEPATAEEPVLDTGSFAEVAAAAKEKFAPGEIELKKVAATRTRKRKDAKKAKRKEAETSYRDYFDFHEALPKLPPHRVLAINRGEQTNVLRVKIEADIEAMFREAEQALVPVDHPHADFLRGCLRDALTRLMLPSLEREIRRELTEKAEKHAVEVFARNLRHLLLQPPIHGRRVLAIDPGYRSGCKVAALDEFGNVLGHGMVHLVGSEERKKQSRHRLVEMIKLYHITAVAIGNGAACREAEQLVADILGEELKDQDVAYVVVNEAGASVYSTSPVGREELPQFDPILRSAVSIGRRLLDPLSELVKINPSNIGVGLYQHDVKAKHLRESLDAVVESCVNYVGVDVNTASPALLRYVSGLNQLTARRLYDYRCQHGPFAHREDMRKVPGIGEATFVQAAGFLKISGGENPLDATWIHPESYGIAERVLEKLGSTLAELAPPPKPAPPTPVTPPVEAPPSIAASAEAPAAPIAETPAETPAAEATSADAPVESAAPAAEAPAAETAVAPPAPTPAPVSAEKSATAQVREKLAKQAESLEVPALATELNVGEHLLKDIITNLTRPGRDPREDLPPPTFRRGIVKLENLEQGMELTGTVLNVVDFGAFCDIGIGDSGLVHISRLADRYIADPHEVVSVGDVLKLWVVSVDKERRRVSLTAIKPGSERARGPQNRRPERKPQGAGAPQGEGQQGGRPPRSGGRSGGGRPGGNRPSGVGAPAAEGRPGVFGAGKPGGGGGGGRPGGGGGGGPRGGGKGGFGGKGPRPSGPPKTYEVKKSAPPKPITKAMKEGRAPMRSFSDLAQFYTKEEPQKPAPPKQQQPPEPPAPPQSPSEGGDSPAT